MADYYDAPSVIADMGVLVARELSECLRNEPVNDRTAKVLEMKLNQDLEGFKIHLHVDGETCRRCGKSKYNTGTVTIHVELIENESKKTTDFSKE